MPTKLRWPPRRLPVRARRRSYGVLPVPCDLCSAGYCLTHCNVFILVTPRNALIFIGTQALGARAQSDRIVPTMRHLVSPLCRASLHDREMPAVALVSDLSPELGEEQQNVRPELLD